MASSKIVYKIENNVNHLNKNYPNLPNNFYSREPKSLKDQYVLEMAQNDQGKKIKDLHLKDPKYQGMNKMEIKHNSFDGQMSEVHYVKDPKTGDLYDFKFKHHIIEKNN